MARLLVCIGLPSRYTVSKDFISPNSCESWSKHSLPNWLVFAYTQSCKYQPIVFSCWLTQNSSSLAKWEMFSIFVKRLLATSNVVKLIYSYKGFDKRSCYTLHISQLAFLSNPSIFSIALWLRYSSSKFSNSSNPSILVKRLLWILRSRRCFRLPRFYKPRETLLHATSFGVETYL